MCMPFRRFFPLPVFPLPFIDFVAGNRLLFRMAPVAYKPFLGNRGFAYLALLVAIVIIGISLGAATRYWSNVSLREKEKELLFRGDQYRTAIERYVKANSKFPQGIVEFPQNIDDLLKDPKTLTKRYLRQKYKDPISGEDFVEIRDPVTNRINGVYSPSEKEPLKKADFPGQDNDFEGKTKYSEWQFVYKLPPGQVGLPSKAGPFPGGRTMAPNAPIIPIIRQ
jgi:type II secretory pathway pseudopilin PulG